ncbi:hypothetical protein BH09VER1_BH09VER1_00940 [soil metagenome]
MSPRRKTPAERKATRRSARYSTRRSPYSNGKAMVNAFRLAPNHSYSDPEFLKRGYYLDQPFACRDCGKAEVWTASQQKWWYEIAKGGVFTQPSRCRPCRRRERERSAEARRVHLEGLAAKRAGD